MKNPSEKAAPRMKSFLVSFWLGRLISINSKKCSDAILGLNSTWILWVSKGLSWPLLGKQLKTGVSLRLDWPECNFWILKSKRNPPLFIIENEDLTDWLTRVYPISKQPSAGSSSISGNMEHPSKLSETTSNPVTRNL